MDKVWYKRPSLWGATVLGIFAIIEGLANIEPAWDFVQRKVPQLFRLLNPLVVFWNTPIILPLWSMMLGIVFLLLIPPYIHKWTAKLNNLPSSTNLLPFHENPAQFRNVWLQWYLDPMVGLQVEMPLRCAENGCNKRIATVARIASGQFLVCEDGHFVGNEQGYIFWKQKFAELQEEDMDKRRKAHNIREETYKLVISDFEAGKITSVEFEEWQKKQPGIPLNEILDITRIEDDSQFLLQMPYDGSEIIYKFIDEFKEEREREGFEYKIRKQSSTK
ncbi:MAG: hypothetical protein Q9P01_13715 [Anaerolineae bacterium]|nr:hypothetical protein [Anaerolineae bacterium]